MANVQRSVRVDAEVPGLRELIAELRRSPERLDKKFRADFRRIAADVRDRARSAAASSRPMGPTRPRTNQPQHWRDLVNSIRSGAQSDSPTVSVGRPSVPWALGFEFGSVQHRQFPPWRGAGPGAGYFFWPQVREAREEIAKRALEAIEDALKPAFPD